MLFEKDISPVRTRDSTWKLPAQTKSICPECTQVLDAVLYEDSGQVWMFKNCPEHGQWNELVDRDVHFFLQRRKRHFELPTGVETPHTQTNGNCPFDCGLCSRHVNTPCMVNIDLTNRCNLNCPICFANANASGHVFELSLEQLEEMLNKSMAIRPRAPLSIQYAGGEPTIHPDFIQAVRMAKAKGVLDIQVASNGLKFAQSKEFTAQAAEAGLNVVYMQFDGLSDDIYKECRGRPLLETKMQAIENLREEGIMVTLVPTIVSGLNDHQVGKILEFAVENSDVITAVSFQPVSLTGRYDESQRKEMRYTMSDMAKDIQEQSGILDMYEDWYPYSIVNPISRLVEAIKKTPQNHFNCHPHCGVASYLLVDRNTKQAVPLTKFFDIQAAMNDIELEAEALEKNSWRKPWSKFQLMRKLKKHFYAEKAPEGLDFDQLLEFVNTFIEAGSINRPERGHFFHVMGQRFDVMLLAAMHFQDAYNFELDRVQHCVIHYAAPNGRFYPFCTWNSGPCHRYAVEREFSRPLPQKENTAQ
ncbi:tetraether lipid synthase Tes [Desulfovermiculus halophilus]|jgi:hypothetical protein|uniref:tetraether lipid synthase Tes n=1 Tax=Desulfovermiculus halophilus TaxID=339722 RepID=UPI000687391E|nr:radical SAM protein [Desulfovermiculus halophilus]